MSTLAAAASAASSSSSTSSPGCVPFVFRRSGGARGRLPAPASGTARAVTHVGAPAAAASGCGRPLCRAAEVLGGGIQSAFFASMDSCSCLEVRTNSFKESESEAAPLMMSPPPPPALPHDDRGSAAAARGGARRRASAGGKPRRGLGCFTPSSTSVN